MKATLKKQIIYFRRIVQYVKLIYGYSKKNLSINFSFVN